LAAAEMDVFVEGRRGTLTGAFESSVPGGNALKAIKQMVITPPRAKSVPNMATTRKIFAE
jgi:hypothetical protein